jgi:hypothetical protein
MVRRGFKYHHPDDNAKVTGFILNKKQFIRKTYMNLTLPFLGCAKVYQLIN